MCYIIGRFVLQLIVSFRCRNTEALFRTEKSRKWGNVLSVAFRKLMYLDAALMLDDLRVPPGNRLEALKGDLDGFYSIRKRPVAFDF